MDANAALKLLQAAGVPAESLALYGRWWQLEVWLRGLAYLVLRALWGSAWETEVNQRASRYAAKDNLVHLVGPDQPDLLGYLDFSLLLQLIDDNWDQFEPFLLDHDVWKGRAVELRAIRNRVGHLRRAGHDDRDRVEQTLRDLQPGFRQALRAIASRNIDASGPWGADPVIAAYTQGGLGSACDHLRRKYRFDVNLGWSAMPWATVPDQSGSLNGVPGILWHLDIGGPERFVDPSLLATMIQSVRNGVVHVYCGTAFGAQIAVPAVDDANDVIRTLTHFVHGFPGCTVFMDRAHHDVWPGDIAGLDSRVLVEHLFATSPSPDDGGSVFGV